MRVSSVNSRFSCNAADEISLLTEGAADAPSSDSDSEDDDEMGAVVVDSLRADGGSGTCSSFAHSLTHSAVTCCLHSMIQPSASYVTLASLYNATNPS